MKVFAISCLLAFAYAAPKPEAEADPQFLGAPYGAPVVAPYHAANCVTEEEVLVTQVCTPTADNICDGPFAHGVYKREAEAEADAQYFAGLPYAAAPLAHAVAPVAAAVAHSVTATVKHACRSVTTEHCVDNP